MKYSDFLYGPQLYLSQVNAMASKKFLYSIRNYILLAIQFITPALFVVLTMLSTADFAGNRNLPYLPISFREYPETVTTLQETGLAPGSIEANIARNYKELWDNLPKKDPYINHEIRVVDTDFENEILKQYNISRSRVNFNFMIGASFIPGRIIAWFQNQAFHTAPLTINVMNNAILR
jgi:ATP-binding cassette, subfamily A (ABC1), member 3